MGSKLIDAVAAAYPSMGKLYATHWAILEAAFEDYYVGTGGLVAPSATAGKLDMSAGTDLFGTVDVAVTAVTAHATTIASLAPSAGNEIFVLIEVDNAGVMQFTSGTAAAVDTAVPPQPTAGRVVHALLYIRNGWTAVDTSLSSANAKAKLIDARIVRSLTKYANSIISPLNWQPSGRLTLSTGAPVPTADVTAATTVYYAPYCGNLIPLWDGANWTTIPFSQKSLSLAGLTADKNYDIFGYLSGGDLVLEALVWTSDTARATALTLTDGFYTKSGAQTRLYLGTIRITATTGQCEDSLLKRYVWNNYNRVNRAMQVSDATAHNYQSATIRQWNNTAGNKVEFVIGLLEDAPNLAWVADVASLLAGQSSTVRASLDSVTSGSSAIPSGSVLTQGLDRIRVGNSGTVKLETIANVGYHYFAVTESSTATNNGLFTGVGLYVGMNM